MLLIESLTTISSTPELRDKPLVHRTYKITLREHKGLRTVKRNHGRAHANLERRPARVPVEYGTISTVYPPLLSTLGDKMSGITIEHRARSVTVVAYADGMKVCVTRRIDFIKILNAIQLYEGATEKFKGVRRRPRCWG